MVVIELVEALAGREPGGTDTQLAAVGVAGGDFALQAGGEELLVGPAVGPGPFGRRSTAAAIEGACNARHR